MNDQDVQLHDRLAAISDDAPTAAAVLRTVQGGYRRQLRRRRWYATGSVVAAVLLVASAATLLGAPTNSTPVGVSRANLTATLGPRSSATSIVPSSDPALAGLGDLAVRSPVAVPGTWTSFDQDGPQVESSPSSLQVGWDEHAPISTDPADPATAVVGRYRGYWITTAEPPLDVGSRFDTIHLNSRNITINGHGARLVTVPEVSLHDHSIPTDPRIIWQLGDGHWISVYSGGVADPDLAGFASAIREVPTVLPPDIWIGLTPKGYTAASSTSSTSVSQMGGPRLSLCRSTTASGATPLAGNGDCLDVHATVAGGGFVQSLVMGSETNAQFAADSRSIDVGGVHIMVNARKQVAWTRWGKATIVVQAPSGDVLSVGTLATLAASVQLSPTLQVRNRPDALVESSLAYESTHRPGAGPTTG
ncbi:hypothetical protein [Nakamurella sp. PAMC28650]|uniref:hypothetical protein n=1 Tax=Nakamurella sp. PAMC28650 TaxID=2762325 RepID=UPI00164D926A|nr:hypothetical protein [Nakamurella sp. PAMC28650]QNK80843.1 hypothetical protein H7F38_22520 [Nakamurella sp. PAMC28650]